jgi:hypothetical protein
MEQKATEISNSGLLHWNAESSSRASEQQAQECQVNEL